MTLRVSFHLRRRAEPAPAVALLLTGDDPAGVLAACARLVDPLLFAVAGGYVLVADSIPDGVPHAVRLRRLSENCYLPADADLVPALRPAEAVDLTVGRGLVFLPNRDPLAFDPARPLTPAAFLAVPKPRREDWEPFPVGNPPADRLLGIVREVTTPPDELLAGDGPPIGTEDSRPPQVGVGRRTLGRFSASVGRGFGAIGKALGSKRLGGLAGKLAGLGAALAPRITEELLGRQEAALQRLLSKFRSGNVDDALRHSVPVGNEPGRGAGVYDSDRLPTHNLGWSFGGLLGSRASSVWAGGRAETWRDLINEYRRAAQQAADRGDFRRAALIYAKLLSDYRAAAEVLSRGGLHREAGILFRDKVHQPDRAAREFEKAGEHDEALRLYRGTFLFVDAGDLLRRLGDEEAAVAEYHRAAARAVELRQDYAEAGDLMLQKTGRADLAGAYFARGWEQRGDSLASRNTAVCAERLIEIFAFAEPREPFWQLLDEADGWLREPGSVADAGRFYNKLARLAGLPHLKVDRDEIRDRARLGLAFKVRQHANSEATPGTAVADLFGRSGHWSPAVVSDAEFSMRATLKQRPKGARLTDRTTDLVRLHEGEVTAAVQAPESGDLFVGFRDGMVVHWHPEAARAQRLYGHTNGPAVLGLASDAGGDWVACLLGNVTQGSGETNAVIYPIHLLTRSQNQYTDGGQGHLAIEPSSLYGLLPLVNDTGSGHELGVTTTNGVIWFGCPSLIPRSENGPASPLPPTTHLKLRVPYYGEPTSFTFQGGSVSWGGRKAFIGWMPESSLGSTLFAPPLAWLVASPVHVELAGLFDNATLYWTELLRQADRLETRTVPFVAPGGFRAAAIWKPGHVVGVTSESRVLWLRARGNRFEQWALPTDVRLPARAVGCFPSRRTTEVLVVLDDGTLVRVPVPG